MSTVEEQPFPLDSLVRRIRMHLQEPLDLYSDKPTAPDIEWNSAMLQGAFMSVTEHLWTRADQEHPLTQRAARDVLVRVGKLFYLNHDALPLLKDYIPEMPSVILLNDFASALTTKSLMPYAVTTIAAMQTIDFQGKTVLDIGCADGALSLAALALGAERVVGVDHASGYQPYFEAHQRQNMHGEQNLAFIAADFTQRRFPKQLAEHVPLEAIDIVLCNMGPHEIYGKKTYLQAIDMLAKLPQAHTYVAGGFALAYALQPRTALRKLKKRGFHPKEQQILAVPNRAEPNLATPAVAFTAQKTPKIYL